MSETSVAWCERCAAEIPDDETLSDEEGVARCPECGGVVAPAVEDDAPTHAPWHFKVLAIGTIGYLIYRLIWFIFWLRQHV